METHGSHCVMILILYEDYTNDCFLCIDIVCFNLPFFVRAFHWHIYIWFPCGLAIRIVVTLVTPLFT